MPSVKVRENEPFEFALRRFKRTCEKAGVLAETRKREFYEKPTQERKRKRAAAVKRHLRRVSRDEVFGADELLLSSASKEVLPVVTLDGQAIGNGRPGPIYQALYAAYQEAKQRNAEKPQKQGVTPA